MIRNYEFTSNSVFVPACYTVYTEGSTVKDNCVKSKKHKPILSAAEMYIDDSSFWQYKLLLDIRRLLSDNRRQTAVEWLKSTNLPFFPMLYLFYRKFQK